MTLANNVLAFLAPWVALDVAAGALDLGAVDWKAHGELFTAIVGLTTMLAGALKASPRWDSLVVAQRRLILAVPAVLGALFGALMEGMPIPVAILNGATAYLASTVANVSERKHAERKGREAAPPPTGDVKKPVGHPPPDPSKD